MSDVETPRTRTTVRRHVGCAVREVIIRTTQFSEEDYHSGIVPAKKHPDGFAADNSNWDRKLKRIARCLRTMDPRYKMLKVTISDSEATQSKALHIASRRLTDKIMSVISGNEPD